MSKEYGVILGITLVIVGCATTKNVDIPSTLHQSQQPVWALKARPSEMVVDVSPAGGVLRWAGSTGTVLGAGVDAVINDKYRQELEEALGDYDTNAVFQERIRERIEAALGPKLDETAPLGSTAGLNSRRDAQRLRYERMGKQGIDLLLDLVMTYGIFGEEGTLAAELECTMNAIPKGSRLYNNTVTVTMEPILASMKLGDPTKGALLETSLDLTVDDDAVGRWSEDNAALFKQHFEASVDAAISALLCDLGLIEEAVGEYHLGKLAMNRKEFIEADQHFAKALALDPTLIDARNGRAVNLSHNDQVDDAIAAAKAIVEANPDYGPAWYNLAWWLAIEQDNPLAAKSYYENALRLGMPQADKIEKAINRAA